MPSKKKIEVLLKKPIISADAWTTNFMPDRVVVGHKNNIQDGELITEDDTCVICTRIEILLPCVFLSFLEIFLTEITPREESPMSRRSRKRRKKKYRKRHRVDSAFLRY